MSPVTAISNENKVELVPHSFHRRKREGLQYVDAQMWYQMLSRMKVLSDNAQHMSLTMESMGRTVDALWERYEAHETIMASTMNLQLYIAGLQLDKELLELRHLRSPTTNNKADVRKQSALVVEDNERAAKAVEGTDRKETTHLNGNANRVGVTNHVQELSQSTFRSRFSIPRVPSAPTYGAHAESPSATVGSGDNVGSGDTVDTIVIGPKAKLKSFEERSLRHEYYHDARFLQSEVSLGSSSEPVEKDDEGDHHDDNNVNPLINDNIKEKSSMYVHLPQKQSAQCTDLPPSLQEPLVDQYPNQRSSQSPEKEKKLSNNNKDPEAEVESSCVVDCLYYTIQCCDCSIM